MLNNRRNRNLIFNTFSQFIQIGLSDFFLINKSFQKTLLGSIESRIFMVNMLKNIWKRSKISQSVFENFDEMKKFHLTFPLNRREIHWAQIALEHVEQYTDNTSSVCSEHLKHRQENSYFLWNFDQKIHFFILVFSNSCFLSLVHFKRSSYQTSLVNSLRFVSFLLKYILITKSNFV
jgi:hypothetical protein